MKFFVILILIFSLVVFNGCRPRNQAVTENLLETEGTVIDKPLTTETVGTEQASAWPEDQPPLAEYIVGTWFCEKTLEIFDSNGNYFIGWYEGSIFFVGLFGSEYFTGRWSAKGNELTTVIERGRGGDGGTYEETLIRQIEFIDYFTFREISGWDNEPFSVTYREREVSDDIRISILSRFGLYGEDVVITNQDVENFSKEFINYIINGELIKSLAYFDPEYLEMQLTGYEGRIEHFLCDVLSGRSPTGDWVHPNSITNIKSIQIREIYINFNDTVTAIFDVELKSGIKYSVDWLFLLIKENRLYFWGPLG